MHFILYPVAYKLLLTFYAMPEAVNKIQHAAIRVNVFICLVASGYSLKSAGAVIECFKHTLAGAFLSFCLMRQHSRNL